MIQLIIVCSCSMEEIGFHKCQEGRCKIVATFNDLETCKKHESIWLAYRKLDQNLKPSSTFCK